MVAIGRPPLRPKGDSARGIVQPLALHALLRADGEAGAAGLCWTPPQALVRKEAFPASPHRLPAFPLQAPAAPADRRLHPESTIFVPPSGAAFPGAWQRAAFKARQAGGRDVSAGKS